MEFAILDRERASFSTDLKGMLDSLIPRYYVAEERVKQGTF
jgi:hypothetical protein